MFMWISSVCVILSLHANVGVALMEECNKPDVNVGIATEDHANLDVCNQLDSTQEEMSFFSTAFRIFKSLYDVSKTPGTPKPKDEIRVSDILKSPNWPDKWPFSPEDFKRQDESDESDDEVFYRIDDAAVGALTKYYGETFTEGADILDICSSWISHFPADIKLGRTVGLGMNKADLAQNKQLSEYVVQNLNSNPVFPFAENSFDFVTCAVSVDYLTRPLEFFSEIRRVLKPGGSAIIGQSNRQFPIKVIKIWLNTNQVQHVFIIGAYFHYAQGFHPPQSIDISPNEGTSDSMFIVKASKV